MQPDLTSLNDIAVAIRKILRFVQDVEWESFIGNDEKQSAVYGQIVIIGEAANRVSTEFQSAHPGFPWRKMIGMRNRVVHAYEEVDWGIVWEVATQDLGKLLSQIEPLLPKPPK